MLQGKIRGVAQPGLERLVWDQDVGGSNPLAPTNLADSGQRLAYSECFTHELESHALYRDFSGTGHASKGVDEWSSVQSSAPQEWNSERKEATAGKAVEFR